MYDGNSIQRRPNAALLLEEIKQEVENVDVDGLEGTMQKTLNSSNRRASVDSHAVSELNAGFDSIRQVTSQSLKSCKHEDEVLVDGGETTFTLFASLLDSALQGWPCTLRTYLVYILFLVPLIYTLHHIRMKSLFSLSFEWKLS